MTITTAEELAALPITSVIRCDDNEGIGLNVCERHKEGWQYVGSSIHFSSAQVASDGVAFTVLYRPDQPTEPVRVLPSREEIRALFHSPHSDTCTGWCETQTERALALFADQRTVEQVKAEAWDEGYDEGWTDSRTVNSGGPFPGADGNPYRLAPAQPTPVFEAMGLETPEVPNVGGEGR